MSTSLTAGRPQAATAAPLFVMPAAPNARPAAAEAPLASIS